MEMSENQPTEAGVPVMLNESKPSDQGSDTRPPRLTGKMTFFLLLTLAAIAVIVVLALIGPVAGGDISVVLSL